MKCNNERFCTLCNLVVLVLDDRIKLMAEATMAIVRDTPQQKIDVMKVEILEINENSPGKPVYAVGELKWGAFRDVEERIGKYWLWGPLKPYVAYIFGVFKDLTWKCSAQFHYTLPCNGCSNCVKPVDTTDLRINKVQPRWWHAFIPRNRPTQGL